MRKYYFVIVFLIALFTGPFHIKADCSHLEKVRLQKLAANVSFSYRYTENINGSITFQITVSNLTDELYMLDKSTNKRYYSNNQDFTITNYLPGRTIQFDFYQKSEECIVDTIFTNYVTLPFYNTYYNSRICEDVQEFKLCQKWLKHRMTYKELYEKIQEYKTEKPVEIITPEEPKKEFDYEKIVDFWAEYYLYILLGIIIVGIGLLYYLDKKTDL